MLDPGHGQDAEDVDPLIGQVLDGVYQVTRLIGQGGMGSVYEAEHVRLANRVAIKLMSPDLASNPEAINRFCREAQVTSQLGHPNIVHVFDFGTAPSGAPFLAMELLAGEDLEQHIGRVGRLSVPTTCTIVKQVASALAATHAKEIIHRDLKPANVFLMTLDDGAPFVKVLDFGISKVRSAKARLTHARIVMGSPQFMSPEQAMGRVDDIDHTSDQWALACIAFEALTGRTPFVGDDVNTLMYQVVHSPAPGLASVWPEAPPALGPVFAKALAKRSVDRYPSIAAFAKAFEDAAAVPVARYKNTLSYPAATTAEAAAHVAEGLQVHIELDDRTVADAQAPEPTPPPVPTTPVPAHGAYEPARDQVTTFSQSAGQLDPSSSLAPGSKSPTMFERARGSRKAVAVTGGAIVLLGVLVGLVLRTPGPKETTESTRAAAGPAIAAPAAAAAPAPTIVATPPAAPQRAAPEPRAQTKRAPVAPPVAPAAAGATNSAPAPAAKPRRTTSAPAKPKRQLFEEL